MKQWDAFLQSSLNSLGANLAKQTFNDVIYFKQPNEHSYEIFREIMQIFDLTQLDIETLQYNQRAIVASVMYLMIGKHYEQFDLTTIVNEFPHSSIFLCRDLEDFNRFFSDFLRKEFKFELPDLFPTIQYVAPYFAVKITYNLPFALRKQLKNGNVRFIF